MSFTYLLSNNNGKVRLKLADTGGVAPGGTATSYGFEDEEIAELLSEGGSVDGAVALGLRSLLVDAARRERAFKLPGLDYDDKGRVAGIKAALELYPGGLPVASVACPVLAHDSGYTDPFPTVR